MIFKKTHLTGDEFRIWSYFLFSKITVLPNYVLTESNLKKAKNILKNVDLKDISYVALALQLDLWLITRDKPLYDGLKKQGFRKVILFDEFLRKI